MSDPKLSLFEEGDFGMEDSMPQYKLTGKEQDWYIHNQIVRCCFQVLLFIVRLVASCPLTPGSSTRTRRYSSPDT